MLPMPRDEARNVARSLEEGHHPRTLGQARRVLFVVVASRLDFRLSRGDSGESAPPKGSIQEDERRWSRWWPGRRSVRSRIYKKE